MRATKKHEREDTAAESPSQHNHLRVDFGSRWIGKPRARTPRWKRPRPLRWQSKRAITSFTSVCMITSRASTRSSSCRRLDLQAALCAVEWTRIEFPKESTFAMTQESEDKKQQRAREGAQAWADYQAKARATREKTERLRALRLARDAAANKLTAAKNKVEWAAEQRLWLHNGTTMLSVCAGAVRKVRRSNQRYR